MRRFHWLIVAVMLSTAALLPCTGTAAYPERPITMIVAYPPGGGTDLVARAIAPYIEKYLSGGAKIVIVNRAGAGGEVGFTALANAPADGYTIGFVNTPPLMTIPIESSTIRATSPSTAIRQFEPCRSSPPTRARTPAR